MLDAVPRGSSHWGEDHVGAPSAAERRVRIFDFDVYSAGSSLEGKGRHAGIQRRCVEQKSGRRSLPELVKNDAIDDLFYMEG